MRSRRASVVACIAAGIAGILGAHALDYLIVVPNGSHRHELLLQTGHAYWPHAAAIGLVAGVLAALASFGAGFASSTGRASYFVDAGTLALIHVGAFVALEGVERIGSGRFAGVLVGPLLARGVLLQVLVAAAVAAVLRAFARAGSAVARLVRARVHHRAAAALVVALPAWIFPRRFGCAPIQRRGPPASVAG